MKNLLIILAFIFLFNISLVQAINFEVTLSSENIIVAAGQSKALEAVVSNNEDTAQIFSVSIWPSYWEGISAIPDKNLIKIDGKSNSIFKIDFNIPDCIINTIQNFELTVKSLSDGTKVTKKISLQTIGGSAICLNRLTIDKYEYVPSEKVLMQAMVKNVIDELVDGYALETVIRNPDGEVIAKYEDDVTIPGMGTFTGKHTYELDKYQAPGLYSVQSSLKYENTVIHSRVESFKVKRVANIVQEKSTSYSFMLQTTAIKVRNEGNYPSTGFYVTETVPTWMRNFFTPIGMYTEETERNKILYHWYIESLQPGEERIVEYQITMFNIWIAAVILGALIIFAFSFVFKPRDVKRFKHRGIIEPGKSVAITIEVKNRGRHPIKDVVVRDFVPGIANVLNKFDTLRPEAKKASGGIELIWKFAELKPREDRVITYYIKPVLEIRGKLKLPKAHLRYLDRKRIIKTTVSKSITIKSR